MLDAGPGPLVLQPRGRGRCQAGEHSVHQLLYVDTSEDGRFQRNLDDQERRAFAGCSATRVQGISPGWVDVYGADLDGQWLMLPRTFTGGLICLDLAADPRELVRETDETDNATSTPVRITGDRARVASSTRCG